jgi:hypothetical protein
MCSEVATEVIRYGFLPWVSHIKVRDFYTREKIRRWYDRVRIRHFSLRL